MTGGLFVVRGLVATWCELPATIKFSCLNDPQTNYVMDGSPET